MLDVSSLQREAHVRNIQHLTSIKYLQFKVKKAKFNTKT